MEGISIVIKGTKKGTNTDNNGNFSLTHTANSAFTITASGVGFKSQDILVDPKGNTKGIAISLTEQFSKLDEVVVTGTSAGTTKRQLGSYVSTVNAEDLNKGATGNILAALQGKTAGAQISQNSGVNWVNVGELSNAGVNWLDIDVLSDTGVRREGICIE